MQKIFEQTCLNRHFELQVAELHKQKLIKIPIYLSLGQEHIPAVLAEKDWMVFPQHRCHSYYLSFGGDMEALFKELLGRRDGCNGGAGGSASVSIPGKMFGHSGLLGDQIPIGVGYAHASGKDALIVGGDAGFEEDYSLAAFGYAASKKCPVLFLCEDNDLSILTTKEVRRSWNLTEVARSFGLEAAEIKDDPFLIRETVNNLKLPAFLNIHTCRALWHAGSGCDGPPKWDAFDEFKAKVYMGEAIEQQAKEKVESICQQLLKQLGK